ncbi:MULTISPECIES: hypothetical protein [Bacillaceae]|uniref:Uncharacterized protein n=1 Tax=Evansella alkalicola TaxID=745819 RepID=A0ABS6JZS7_9BACI|nr:MULTISPECIES: hypothetical protein [Bacillaceae]MBU9724089.1 hypothetical protein [Bacillus alkalicola]
MSKMRVLLLFILLISSFLITTQVFAEEPEEDVAEAECENKEDVIHRHKAIQTHIQFYYELLIDKYKPELKEEWKEVISEREVILKKMKEMQKEGLDLDYSAISEEWKEKHQKYHEAFLEAVKTRDDEKIRELLPKLLELQKSWNEDHKKFLREN